MAMVPCVSSPRARARPGSEGQAGVRTCQLCSPQRGRPHLAQGPALITRPGTDSCSSTQLPSSSLSLWLLPCFSSNPYGRFRPPLRGGVPGSCSSSCSRHCSPHVHLPSRAGGVPPPAGVSAHSWALPFVARVAGVLVGLRPTPSRQPMHPACRGVTICWAPPWVGAVSPWEGKVACPAPSQGPALLSRSTQCVFVTRTAQCSARFCALAPDRWPRTQRLPAELITEPFSCGVLRMA